MCVCVSVGLSVGPVRSGGGVGGRVLFCLSGSNKEICNRSKNPPDLPIDGCRNKDTAETWNICVCEGWIRSACPDSYFSKVKIIRGTGLRKPPQGEICQGSSLHFGVIAVHGFILVKVAAVPRSGARLSVPLSARENADLMDFLSFIR